MKIYKRIGAVSLLLAVFTAASATSDAAGRSGGADRLSSMFNRQAAAGVYGASCSARETSRRKNIRSPSRQSTAADFRQGGSALALFSPHLTSAHRSQAQAAFNSVPRHVMDLFYPAGGVAIFTERTLAEALPGNKNSRQGSRFPYLSDYGGLYRADEKRVFVTFNIARVADKNKDGIPEISGYTSIANSGVHNLHHEMGHFIDDIVGEVGSRSNSSRFTDRSEYMHRLAQDVDKLAAAKHSRAVLSRRAYYLPQEYKGVQLYGSKSDVRAIRREVFAELWAEVQGHNQVSLKNYFPRTYELVQALNEDLKRLHASQGRQCGYEGYIPGGRKTLPL